MNINFSVNTNNIQEIKSAVDFLNLLIQKARIYPTFEELEFSTRILNCLKNEGIENTSQLLSWSQRGLIGIPNLGLKAINEIKENLSKFNLKINGDL